jgi:DNA-binding LacI/PurR family transcriptional regulator
MRRISCGACQTAGVSTSGPPGRNPPTLEEVATRAGVSRATASRVLRGARNVSEAARASVLAAAEAISYTPNRAARSLVTGRSDSIAFLVAETQDRLFSDPFFIGLLRGAQNAIAAGHLQLVFTVANTPADDRRFLQYAAGGHVDGVLLLSLHGNSDLPLELELHGVPTVLSGRPLVGAEQLCYVDSDNVGGAGMATRHLIDSGRTTIATIAGPQDMSVGQDRLAGYRQTLIAAGREVREDLILNATFTGASGFEAMSELLRREPNVDAVFAASDLMALGAMRAIQGSGVRVFDDIAVIGFDDIAEAEQAHPALTTVRQPVAELGRTMSIKLLQRIHGEATEQATVLPVELVVRASA